MRPLSLRARAAAAGVPYATVKTRRRLGWIEADLFVPSDSKPIPRGHKPATLHPWRRENAADTHVARLSSLNYRRKGRG